LHETQKQNMGVVKTVIDDIFNSIEDVVSFIILYTLTIFAFGIFWGYRYAGTEEMWWPIYLLFIGLFIKVIKDWST